MAQNYLESLLGEHEKVVLVSRQHWFTLARSILFEIVSILIIFAAAIILAISFPLFAVLIVAIGFIILLIPLATMTADILNWSHRQYIITNRRVMQIAGVFNKNVTDSSLEKVNDVKMEQSFFGRLFDFGDVEILTASELGVNLFKRIGNPVRFKTAMLNAKERLERGDESGAHLADIPGMIAKLDQLRQQGILTEEEFQRKKADLLAKM
jgi:uncharacterized membrane protein YdbT with pleckstrin-like domain